MSRYFLHIAYQGTRYNGWQKQLRIEEKTIQGIVEGTLAKLLSLPIEEIKVVGSSRTDRGVHALEQVAHLDLPEPIDTEKIKYHANLILPKDIAIRRIWQVSSDLHARFNASQRTYIYSIMRQKDPFESATHYYFRAPLNLELMNALSNWLCQQADFKSFCKTHSSVLHFQCTLTEAYWIEKEEKIVFTISANRFLRGMVRAIVGTLIRVGRGLMTPEEFKQIVLANTHHAGAVWAPAQGLCLVKVRY